MTLFNADAARAILEQNKANALFNIENETRLGHTERSRFLLKVLTEMRHAVELNESMRSIQVPADVVNQLHWVRGALERLGFDTSTYRGAIDKSHYTLITRLN